jgi:hypothetical protein
MTWREMLRGLARDLMYMTLLAACFSVLFIAGDLIFYGRVKW